MNGTSFPRRFYTLDVSRGLASLAIVLWHWQHFFATGYCLPERFDRERQPLYCLLFPFYEHGDLAVGYFFVLSGFVFFWLYETKIADRSCGVFGFAVLRFARLYPLHVATLGVVLLLQVLFRAQTDHYFVYPHNDAYHFVLHLFFASYWGFEDGFSFNAPVWSVSIEVILYAIFFMLAFAKQTRLAKLVAIVCTLVLMAALDLGGRWPLPAAAFFIGGIAFKTMRSLSASRWRAGGGLIVFSTVVLWSLAILSCRVPVKDSLIRVIGGFVENGQGVAADKLVSLAASLFPVIFLFPLTICSLVVLELRFVGLGRRLKIIGDITYSSYLLHFPLQIVFVLVLDRLGCEANVFNLPITLFAFYAILILASIATYRCFELPVQRAIRKRAARHVAV